MKNLIIIFLGKSLQCQQIYDVEPYGKNFTVKLVDFEIHFSTNSCTILWGKHIRDIGRRNGDSPFLTAANFGSDFPLCRQHCVSNIDSVDNVFKNTFKND